MKGGDTCHEPLMPGPHGGMFGGLNPEASLPLTLSQWVRKCVNPWPDPGNLSEQRQDKTSKMWDKGSMSQRPCLCTPECVSECVFVSLWNEHGFLRLEFLSSFI